MTEIPSEIELKQRLKALYQEFVSLNLLGVCGVDEHWVHLNGELFRKLCPLDMFKGGSSYG